jgi:hypothetical protein
MFNFKKFKIYLLGFVLAISSKAILAGVTGFEVAYGTVSADGKILSGSGVKTKKKTHKGIIKYKFKPKFQHSAVVIFTPLGVTNSAVRIVKNDSQNRKKRVDSDSYNLNSVVGEKPSKSNMKLSFIALEKVNHGYTSTHLQSSHAQLVTYKWVDGVVDAQSNVSANESYKQATGEYYIKFKTAFDGTPGAVANYNQLMRSENQGTPSNPVEPIRSVTLLELDADHAVVAITDENGLNVDSNFTFIAIGKAAQGVSVGLLSEADIAYGRYQKGDNEDRMFGYRMGESSKDDPASYEIPFTEPFSNNMFVVANVEHESENHLRQVQINGTKTQANLQVAGRTVCCSLGAGNDARYDILAIYPGQ